MTLRHALPLFALALAPFAVAEQPAAPAQPEAVRAPEEGRMPEDKAALMVAEMRQAFDGIHERYGRPVFSFVVLNDDEMKIKIAPGMEALRALEAEKSKQEAANKHLVAENQRIVAATKAEIAERTGKVERAVAVAQADVNRRVRALELAAAERKTALESDEAARIGKLKTLDEQIDAKRELLRKLTLEASVVQNDLTTMKRDAVGVRADLAGERARLVEIRREREFLSDELIKKAAQLDQVNQLLTPQSK